MGFAAVFISLATVLFFVSTVGTVAALVVYMRRGDASAFGFGFAGFYYGEMRRSHPRIFQASLGGAVGGILLIVAAGVLRRVFDLPG